MSDDTQLRREIDRYKDLLHSIELYVKWRYVTKQLTTDQKELWADAVETVSNADHPNEPREVDRWWRDDAPAQEGDDR